MSFTTEAHFSSPAGMVEIRNYHWPTPLDDEQSVATRAAFDAIANHLSTA